MRKRYLIRVHAYAQSNRGAETPTSRLQRFCQGVLCVTRCYCFAVADLFAIQARGKRTLPGHGSGKVASNVSACVYRNDTQSYQVRPSLRLLVALLARGRKPPANRNRNSAWDQEGCIAPDRLGQSQHEVEPPLMPLGRCWGWATPKASPWGA